MLDGLTTPDLAPRLVLAIGGVGVALLILIFVLLFLKRRNSPLFIKGGKAREARLMVLDAAAVDPKRRLVLIRRDEVEHLIMIGGPTDIVIETGIGEWQPATARKPDISVEDLVSAPRQVAASAEEPRPELRAAAEAAVQERKPEPVVQPVQRTVERAAPIQAEARPEPRLVQPESRPVQAEAKPVQPEVRPVQPEVKPTIPELKPVQREFAAVSAQPVVPLDSLPGRSAQTGERNVSAMGSMLYDEDREPMTGSRPEPEPVPLQPAERPVLQQQAVETPVARPVQTIVTPQRRDEPVLRPTTVAAEAALDFARSRVLSSEPASASNTTPSHEDDEAKAIAARLEAARADATRRVQSAQPANLINTPAVAQPAAQPVMQPFTPIALNEAAADAAKARDAVPSDFEKLLEAELDASGIFAASNAPQVRVEPKDSENPAAGFAAPPVRSTPPITGATPDLSSEEEVARLLGEIAVNRKS